MVALAHLQPASFRGAKFLVPEDELDQGPNTIDHKFPGQTNRYAEYNGATAPEFHLTCYIHGANLLGDWSRLETALNKPGSGTLRHPWLGVRLCSVKGPYKVKRTDHDSGVLKIEVCFLETGPATLRTLPVPIPATITTLARNIEVRTLDEFEATFPSLMPVNPISALYVLAVVRSIASLISNLFASTSQVATSFGIIQLAGSAVRAVDLLAMFEGPFADKAVPNGALVTGYASTFNALVDAAGEVEAIAATTWDLTQKKIAADFFITSAMAACFAALAEAMAAKARNGDYKNADTVEADMSMLATALADLSVRDLTAETRVDIADLYARISAILQSLEVTLPRIVDIPVPAVPASVLSYWLYDSDEKQDALIGLNPTQSPLLLDGDTFVLRQ